MNLSISDLQRLLSEAAELGAANYAKRITPGNDLISQRQAFREFLESRVRRWKREWLVKPVRMGSGKNSKILYSRSELLAADQAEKLGNTIYNTNKYNNEKNQD